MHDLKLGSCVSVALKSQPDDGWHSSLDDRIEEFELLSTARVEHKANSDEPCQTRSVECKLAQNDVALRLTTLVCD